jgi:hypothetical protein
MGDSRDPASGEPLQESIDPHRDEERQAVRAEIAARLGARGVGLTGGESSEELVELLDAVERFERAVERHGGDLMVDEGPHGTTNEPDDAHFVLPKRGPHEPVASYRNRLEAAASGLRGHPRHPDHADGGEARA